MGSAEAKLAQMGIELPTAPAPVANYVPAVRTGNLMFLSGLGPAPRPDGTAPSGKVGSDLTVEEGYEAARLTGLSLLGRLKQELGDLDRVERVVKLLGMVNCGLDFTDHPAVINGCSDLLVEVLADKGHHARSAVGMSSLPFDIPVEIEAIVEVRDEAPGF